MPAGASSCPLLFDPQQLMVSSASITQVWKTPLARRVVLSPPVAEPVDGPGTVAWGWLCSLWPSAVQTAPISPHAASAGSAMVTSPAPSGCTVINHLPVEPSDTADTPVTVPPTVSSASSLNTVAVTGSSRSKFNRNVNGSVPLWWSGMWPKYAIGGAVARSPSVAEPTEMLASTCSPCSQRSPSVAHQ